MVKCVRCWCYYPLQLGRAREAHDDRERESQQKIIATASTTVAMQQAQSVPLGC